MPDHPTALMLFAAGFGTRMGALTASRPKPLIPVAGRALIDRALALTDGVPGGVPVRVANLPYLGDQIAAHLAGRGVALAWERGDILDTGGGLRAALPLLGPGPVFTLNTDAVWTGENPLAQLRAAWDGARMDVLQMLLPLDQARGGVTRGDFRLGPDGRLSRGAGGEDHRYLGAQIIRTDLLHSFPEQSFSLNRLWDRMIAAGRAYGIVHQGGWCDVGSPAGLAEAEAMVAHGG